MASATPPGVGTDGVVIGEAVALDVPLAGFGVRLAGALLDAVAQLVLLFVGVLLLVASVGSFDRALTQAGVVVLMAMVFVGLPTIVETMSGGRSLGKLACGTRVVRADNGPIGSRQALVRSLIGFVEIWGTGGVAAILSMILTARGQRLGDLAASTVVVRDRIRLVTPLPAPMPPHLTRWAASADISALPSGLAMTIRQFLLRRMTLSPIARGQLGAQLLAEVRPHVNPQPPDWVSQEDILMAVVAERGRRDFLRLTAESDLRQRLLGIQ
ncbi:MAG: RDD family protein [Propionibacteriaceae bacterium]|nr:RDD family protein [Micropruina sp.]